MYELATIESMQQADAVFLLLTSVGCLVVIVEDRTLYLGMRIVTGFIGFFAFAQAMWLLGEWVPGAAGYPWPRMTLDLAMCAGAILRAIMAVTTAVRERRRLCGRLHGYAIHRNRAF